MAVFILLQNNDFNASVLALEGIAASPHADNSA